MKTILISFPDDKARDLYLRLTKLASDKMLEPQTIASDPSAQQGGDCLRSALGTVKLDPPIKQDHERMVAVFVSGRKMAEGPLTTMQQRFQQEVDSHSANVEVRELRDGEWIIIRRRLQQQQGRK